MRSFKKNNFSSAGGFTLIELLLAIAIIGILASVVTVNLSSQRLRALSTSAMETANSTLAYAVDCYLQGKSITNLANATAGNKICNESPLNWPAMPDGCTYKNVQVANNRWRIECTKGSQNIYVACFIVDAAQGDGRCCITTGDNYTCQ